MPLISGRGCDSVNEAQAHCVKARGVPNFTPWSCTARPAVFTHKSALASGGHLPTVNNLRIGF